MMPGVIFEDLVKMGSAPGEGYFSAPGYIRAYSVVTGKVAWTFHTIPNPGEYGYNTWPLCAYKYVGGVNVWSEMSVDEKRGIVYLPLGWSRRIRFSVETREISFEQLNPRKGLD